jgi:hypothetical protein
MFSTEFWSYFYTQGINPIPDAQLSNIFSSSVGFLQNVLNIYFTWKKVFSLIQIHLSILAFVSCAWRSSPKYISLFKYP